MARKIPVKLVMQYRDQGFSRNMIAKTQKVGRTSVSEVFKRADKLKLTYEDIEELSDNEVYRKFFPERHQSECCIHFLITKRSIRSYKESE